MTSATAPPQRSSSQPLPASQHRGFSSARGGTAVTMLTVYLVLLFAFPSHLRFEALGSLGKPAILWGLVLLLWWVLTHMQRRDYDARPVSQPIRVAFLLLVLVALVSFAAAMLRGQPVDQQTPAISAVIRLASWAGVLFVTLDGVRTHDDVFRLLRRLVVAGMCVAVLGLLQFLFGATLLEWMSTLPGLEAETGGIDVRSGFIRATGTATHPLEYTAAITGALPLAIAVATAASVSSVRRRAGWWWAAVLIIVAAAGLSVSRSAMIGLVVAVVCTVPLLPRLIRRSVIVGILVTGTLAVLAVPGLLSTTIGLFTGAGNDPSALSRSNALERVPEFVSTSPVFGLGLGTFLPRYYIFDNQWVHTLVELGVLGALGLFVLVVCGVWSALFAYRRSPFAETRIAGGAIAAALVTISVLFLFFDGLSFGISAGMFFFLLGLAGAMRTIAVADRDITRPGAGMSADLARAAGSR